MKFLAAEEYGPTTERLFALVAGEVRTLVPDARIEHVGASAVPGAISKGDLDVFVGIKRREFENAIRALNGLGYAAKEDTLRTESLCMMETGKYDSPVAIQLVENGSRFEMFLTFRDALRQDGSLLRAYNEMKRNCEGRSEEHYRVAKASFIEAALTIREPVERHTV